MNPELADATELQVPKRTEEVAPTADNVQNDVDIGGVEVVVVAEKAEDGTVEVAGWASSIIVHVGSGRPAPAALIAAVALARALEVEIRSVYVEDEALIGLAALPCAREVSIGGGRSGLISVARLQSDMTLASMALRRDLGRLAAQAGIPLQGDVVRDEPLRALAGVCEIGAIITLTEPFDRAQALALPVLFDTHQAAGVLVCGPHAIEPNGPILVLLADVAGVNALMEAAGQLQRPDGRPLAVMALGHDSVDMARIVAAARIASGYDQSVKILADPHRFSPVMIADTANRLGAGLIIARWHDAAELDLAWLVGALDCPVLLLR